MEFRNSVNKPVAYSGEEITWRVSAYGIVINEEGKILLIKAAHSNLWQVPGGQVEMHERVADAVHREGLEETGYDISVAELIPLAVNEDYFFHEGKKQFYKSLQLYFYGKLNSTERDLTHMDDYDSQGGVAWVDFSELTVENTQTTLWPIIQKIKNNPNF